MDGQHDKEPGADARCRVYDRLARERRIASLAARQHVAIDREQLLAAGFSANEIDARLRTGRLHPLHRSVYLLGPPIPREWTYEMAAVLACGAGAFLGGRSATSLWSMLPHPAQPGPVDVIVAGRNPGTKPGIRIHRVASLDPGETRIRFNIPVISPARTLLDLAATHPNDLEAALAEAYAKRLTNHNELTSLAAKHPRHRGSRRLRALTASDRAPARLRSEAERRFLALLRRAHLPQPAVNVRVGPYLVDFLWRNHKLVVEVDGYAYHSSRAAFERDRLRDADLQARGFSVVRVTWRQITEEPEALLVRLAQALPYVRGG